LTSTLICDVCPRQCKLEEGQTGYCNVRKNEDGKNIDSLYGLFYPYPEENNQLAPGSYTVVFPGCGLKCWFCNASSLSVRFTGDTSRWPTGTYRKLSPREFAEKAKKSAGPSRGGFTCGMGGLFGGEPTLHFEYIIEASRICHELGCITKLHTSGYVNERVMTDLSKAVDAISINVKGSAAEEAYKPMSADPAIVLESIRTVYQNCRNVWVRNLIGPYNSSLWPGDKGHERFGRWLLDNTDSKIPVLVEPMLEPMDPDEFPAKGRAPAGDDDHSMSMRCLLAAEIFVKNGLTNVWVLEGLSGRVRQTHVPSGREFDVRLA
jgi:pyruvate formate lyase activating enzyme